MEGDLRLNLQQGVASVETLQAAVAHCGQARDFATGGILEGMTVHQAEDIDWLETQLETIRQIGIDRVSEIKKEEYAPQPGRTSGSARPAGSDSPAQRPQQSLSSKPRVRTRSGPVVAPSRTDRVLLVQNEPQREGSKVCTCSKVCTDTESSVVGLLSMGIASVMFTLSFLPTMTSSTTICRISLRCSGATRPGPGRRPSPIRR